MPVLPGGSRAGDRGCRPDFGLCRAAPWRPTAVPWSRAGPPPADHCLRLKPGWGYLETPMPPEAAGAGRGPL
eukprot:5822757-Lingulodinium_polyedra.AAC.1